jgi:hypothetical protein
MWGLIPNITALEDFGLYQLISEIVCCHGFSFFLLSNTHKIGSWSFCDEQTR